MNEALLVSWREEDLQEFVRTTSEAVGAYHYHTRDSRKSGLDYPDSNIVLPPRVIYAELKKVGGVPTMGQLRVLELLEACPGVEVYLWDPFDWREIEEVLGIVKGRNVEPTMHHGLECGWCRREFSSRSSRSSACSVVCKGAMWVAAGGRKRGRAHAPAKKRKAT